MSYWSICPWLQTPTCYWFWRKKKTRSSHCQFTFISSGEGFKRWNDHFDINRGLSMEPCYRQIWRETTSHFTVPDLIQKNQRAWLWRKKSSWETTEIFSKNQIQLFCFPLVVAVTGQMLVASFTIMERFLFYFQYLSWWRMLALCHPHLFINTNSRCQS